MLPTEIGMEYFSFLYEFHFPEPVLRYPSPPPFLLLFLPSSLSLPPFPAVTRHLSLHYTREKRETETDRQTDRQTDRDGDRESDKPTETEREECNNNDNNRRSNEGTRSGFDNQVTNETDRTALLLLRKTAFFTI